RLMHHHSFVEVFLHNLHLQQGHPHFQTSISRNRTLPVFSQNHFLHRCTTHGIKVCILRFQQFRSSVQPDHFRRRSERLSTCLCLRHNMHIRSKQWHFYLRLPR